MEPLKFARENGGIAISFNGNEYPLKVAQIAIVSPSAIATILVCDVYVKYDKNKVLEFIRDYNNSNDYNKLFEEYYIDSDIQKEFFSNFTDKYPLIQIVSDDNYETILKESKQMRNTLRGQDIGELG